MVALPFVLKYSTSTLANVSNVYCTCSTLGDLSHVYCMCSTLEIVPHVYYMCTILGNVPHVYYMCSKIPVRCLFHMCNTGVYRTHVVYVTIIYHLQRHI